MAYPVVGLVMVHFGDPRLTSAALTAVAAGTVRPQACALVDNGPGQLASEVAPADLPLELLATGSNLGFARGANVGAAALADLEPDFYWFLNNDTLPDADALRLLLEASSAGGNALISSRIVEIATGRDWFDQPRFLPLLLESRHSGRDRRGSVGELPSRADWLCASYLPATSLLVPGRIWRQLGGFADDFFMYGEDIDLCIRATRAGAGLQVARGSVVRHRTSSGMTPVRRDRAIACSLVLVEARHFAWLLPIGLCLGVLVTLGRAIRHRRPSHASRRLRGYLDGMAALAAAGRHSRASGTPSLGQGGHTV